MALSVQLDDDAEQRVQKAAQQSGMSVDQWISHAIANGIVLTEQKSQGAQVLLKQPDQSVQELK